MSKPIQKLKDGLITATIWANQNDDGKTRYSVNITRSYLKDETWQETTSFSNGELLRVARLANKAYDAIGEHIASTGIASPAEGDAA